MKYFLFFLGISALLVSSFVILYFGRLRPLKNKEVEYASDEMITTYSNPGRTKEILRSVVLNKLTVEDSSFDVIELGGERKPLLNLTVSFDYQGVNRKLTIPVVENILLKKLAFNDFDEGELISVASLNLKKGTLVNVAFSYIPEESELIKFCEARSYQLCLMYIELEFGDELVDFSTYLDRTLNNQNAPRLNYTIAFPNTVFLLSE